MEGAAEPGRVGCASVRLIDPATKKARSFAFDRCYWSADGFAADPQRPGYWVPDGPESKYVSQEMVWDDLGEMLLRYGLSGCAPL